LGCYNVSVLSMKGSWDESHFWNKKVDGWRTIEFVYGTLIKCWSEKFMKEGNLKGLVCERKFLNEKLIWKVSIREKKRLKRINKKIYKYLINFFSVL
jgi:hypothetical protein